MNIYKAGNLLTVQINSLSFEGEGISILNDYRIYIPGVLVNEKVKIKIIEVHKTYAKATLIEVIEPSPLRVQPQCSLFGTCGGCQIMHMSYAQQLDFKKQKVLLSLKKFCLDFNVFDCLPSPLEFAYRSKIQLPIVYDNDTLLMGLYKSDSHELIPFKECAIQCKQGETILKHLRLFLEKNKLKNLRHILVKNTIHTEQALLIFVTSQANSIKKQDADALLQTIPFLKGVIENVNSQKGNSILGDTYSLLSGENYIEEKLLNKSFQLGASSFFQVNPLQIEHLYKKALEIAEITKNDIVVDAFCGVGTMSLFAADFAKKVIGIESVAEAIKNAYHNSTLNHITNCQFICGLAEIVIKQIAHCDVLFLNPPRKGCQAELLSSIFHLKPKTIIYISCNPQSLARDLAFLSQMYNVDYVQPFDMFPQTNHVETLVRLKSI